STQVSRLTLC
ncbi:anticodon-binding domain of tRNA family protein, partial [Vibrio parahaemolyticus V-223/04]